jgi:hypothetical protein
MAETLYDYVMDPEGDLIYTLRIGNAIHTVEGSSPPGDVLGNHVSIIDPRDLPLADPIPRHVVPDYQSSELTSTGYETNAEAHGNNDSANSETSGMRRDVTFRVSS